MLFSDSVRADNPKVHLLNSLILKKQAFIMKQETHKHPVLCCIREESGMHYRGLMANSKLKPTRQPFWVSRQRCKANNGWQLSLGGGGEAVTTVP